MLKYDQQKTQFLNALLRFQELLEPKTMVERDALIQRFEFTFDTGWKTLKTLLEEQYSVEAPTPLQAFQEAIRVGILDSLPVWLQMRDMRNLTSHSYSEKSAVDVTRSAKDFSDAFERMKALFEKTISSYESSS